MNPDATRHKISSRANGAIGMPTICQHRVRFGTKESDGVSPWDDLMCAVCQYPRWINIKKRERHSISKTLMKGQVNPKSSMTIELFI